MRDCLKDIYNKMLIVIDANELFSLLIKGSKESEAIFFSNDIELIAPEFLLIELSKNKQEILEKTYRSEEEFGKLISIFERRVKLIPKREFEEFIPKTIDLFQEHTKDVQYLALALKFNCPLWSEEKLLKQQSLVKVYTTQELIEKLLKNEI